MHCDVGEVMICAEFHQWSKPMKHVGCDVWCRLNGIIQLSLVSMEDDIGLPLFLLRTKHQYSMEKPQEKYSTP
jgi:hypothetical protein